MSSFHTIGTRSVSTLTPSQLARKRANDREAQRAIRARTKEHIERLEQELAELKCHQSRDKTVQELLRRNKALEEELMRLRESMGLPISSSPYSAPAGTTGAISDDALDMYLGRLTPGPSVYDDNLSSGSGAIPSPRLSPMTSSDFGSLPEYGQHYVPLSNSCETWASTLPHPGVSNHSTPSSPGNGDEYNSAYIPTSVPNSMLPHGSHVRSLESDDIEAHGMQPPISRKEILHRRRMLTNSSDPSFRLNGHLQTLQPTYNLQQHHQQQRSSQWNMYPVYYGNNPNTACVSR